MDPYRDASNWSDEPPKLSERELLEWLASFSPRHETELRRLRSAEAEVEAKVRHDRELLEWLATISEKHERELWALERKEAEEREAQETWRRHAHNRATQEVWDSSKHPRLGGPPNAGWWASNGGASAGAHTPPSPPPSTLPKYPHPAGPSYVERPASAGGSQFAAGAAISAVHIPGVGFPDNARTVYFASKKKAGTGGNAGAAGASATPGRVTGAALEKARKEFNGMRSRLWREEAEKNPQKYTPEQLAAMRKGNAPKSIDGISMEIHHKKPLSEGGTNTYDNFQFGTRFDHRLGPNLKKNHPNLPRGSAQ